MEEMGAILFSGEAHEHFYYQMMERYGDRDVSYRRPLFYLLGVCNETRRSIDSMFDFEEMSIKPESLHTGWQTGGTRHLTRMAFNLWNGWTEDGKENLSTPYELFACGFAPYFLQAVKLRYPEYCETP
jgi:hypothetical protein